MRLRFSIGTHLRGAASALASGVLVGVALAAPMARAQSAGLTPPPSAAVPVLPVVRVVSEDASGVRLEVTAAYPAPLATTFEAARVDRIDARAVRVAGGEALFAAHALALPSLGVPTVTVVSADGDAADVATGSMAEVLAAPLVTVGTPGRMRGGATVGLSIRLADYDASTRRMTRYRRLVVDVRYGAAVPAPTGMSAGPLGSARFSSAVASVPNPHLGVARSALADGTWYRLAIPADGVYRLDRDAVTAMGLSPGSLDPSRIRVFGGSGQPLPTLTDAPRVADLVEYASVVRGGGDGSFDAADGVVFYARGPVSWRRGSFSGAWEHTTHPYATETAVFIRIDDAPITRRTPASAPAPASSPTALSTVEGRYVREFDDVMWAKEDLGTGEQWFSRILTGATTTPVEAVSSANLPGLTSGFIRYDVRAAIRTVNVYPSATLRFVSGGQTVHEADFFTVGSFSTDPQAADRSFSFTQTHSGSAFSLGYRIGTYPSGTRAEQHQGAVDYIRVFYPQRLAAENGLVRFATPRDVSGDVAFRLTGFASAPEVWDVTDPTDVRRVATVPDGDGYRVSVVATSPRELVAFADAGLRRLTARGVRVTNQNVHGETAYPDLVVVTPAALREQAERLAAHRRRQGLRVEVTLVDALYNEFSGGVPDVRAVRDYLKFLYDRAPNDGQRLRYALLFGDGHFNYRRIRPIGGDTTLLANHVLPYETPITLDPISSFTTDDYFGLLDDGEGLMNDGERMDVAIGRLPVQTLSEARQVVDKLIRYDDPASHGPWRSRYLFTADDAYTSSSGEFTDADLHVQNADIIAEYVRRAAPRFDVEKVYTPSYERVFTVGWRVPAAREAILSALRDGALVFNYFGHGRDDQLADEFIFTKKDAEDLDNGDRLPIFITATCSFGRWDLDQKQSGAEALILNPRGGGIAAFTTVRLVYTDVDSLTNNPGINRYLTEGLVTRLASGTVPRLGDALLYMKAKEDCPLGCPGSVRNGRKFNLLGDPSMGYGVPVNSVRVETVGGVNIAGADTTGAPTAPLRALDRVTVEGSVRRPDGGLDAAFTGRVTVTVFDAERIVRLPYARHIASGTYRVREDLIWRGEVPVASGRFTAAFVVPKDISYADRRGRITAYATGGGAHALGATERVLVGGSSPVPNNDRTGPRVRVFVGDTTFVSGGYAPAESELIVRLDDETGINTVGSGVGHELLLVVNGDETRAVNLGSRFVADAGAPNRGEVRYRLTDLAPGVNRLRVRAWDVVGNVSESEVAFSVAESADLDVRRVLAFPNPSAGATRFVFEHNQPAGTAGRVRVQVFSIDGRLVRVLDDVETLPTGALPSGRVQIAWDGRDADGDRLAPGVYLFKVRVERDAAGEAPRQVAERIERLVVL